MTTYQIFAPLASLIAILYAWNLVLRQKKSMWEAMLWSIFWGMVALIAVYPNTLRYLSQITGIRDQANAMLVTSIGILFFMVFYMVVRLEELEQRQTRLIRQLALRESESENDDSSGK